jgi:N-acetylglucosaminyldiphosphoundecaprenol N-acetyl-beta-D-mannosaminyltransferase
MSLADVTRPAAPQHGVAMSVMMTLVRKMRLIRTNPDSLLLEMMSDRNCVVSFVNTHAMNLACKSAEFFRALSASDMLLRDGKGTQILLNAIGIDPGLNMNGTDFISKVILAGKDHSIALCGSTAQTAAAAGAYLEKMGVREVTHCDGFRAPDDYLQMLRAKRPRIVILGMGMPKQELLSALIARELPGPVLIVNGGAILDFMAGRFGRAPRLMRRLGLEWLFRLILEPARLWRRYLIGNVIFLWRTAQIAVRARTRKLDPANQALFDQPVVYELGPVLDVQGLQSEGQSATHALEGLDDQASLAQHDRRGLSPPASNVG